MRLLPLVRGRCDARLALPSLIRGLLACRGGTGFNGSGRMLVAAHNGSLIGVLLFYFASTIVSAALLPSISTS